MFSTRSIRGLVFILLLLLTACSPPAGKVRSATRFQVFILTPIRTCVAGDDFVTGQVCRGPDCGDCDCTWEQFDPPAPLLGIPPNLIDSPAYAQFDYRECFEVTLSDGEINDIQADMLRLRDLVYEWTDGALDLQIEFTILPVDYTGFVAPDFAFGPFEVDDELLNPYVDPGTDFIYVVTGVTDRLSGLDLAYWCGGSYGEMSVRGAGYSFIQYNRICNRVWLGGRSMYEPLVHEWIHNLDWALYNLNDVPDLYQFAGPDWAGWQHGDWPACGQGADDPLAWFPSIDFCEWDPDWIDCNNTASAGFCPHAGENDSQISWYEHVLSVHYPRSIQFVGNSCRDGRQDFGETGVDQGGVCP